MIADDGKSMGIAWCVYGERRRPSHEDDGLPLFMLKERKHADQEEVRFVYIPIKPITEEHLDLPPLPDLMDCCKLMEHIPE